MENLDLKQVLIRLKKDIERIREVMISVSTGGYQIDELDEEYKSKYNLIDSCFHLLNNKYGIDLIHENPHESLWQFHAYWKEHLQSYSERRNYVYELYKNNIKDLNKLRIEIGNYGISSNVKEKSYLEIENVPDDFYRQLINLINECYNKEVYAVVPVLIRKLLESLIVDILKSKYGHANVNMFFDSSNNKYFGFNRLLKTFEDNLNDFKVDMPSLDKRILREISRFREKGNTSVHVLELDINKDKSELDRDKGSINHIVKLLIRLEKNVTKLR